MTNGLRTRLQDGEDRTVTFTGRCIAEASSHNGRSARPRWTEIAIYALDEPEGGYVVHKIGATVVQHDPQCRKIRRAGTLQRGPYDPYRTDCRDCLTQPEDVLLDADTKVVYERNHYTTKVAATAQGAVAGLYSLDGRGLYYLTVVAEDAAREAAAHDESFAEAFHSFDASSLRDRAGTR